MRTKLFFLFMMAAISISVAQTPVAQWLFDDPSNLTLASVGDDLILIGTDSAVVGPVDGDGAVSIGIGSHYIANPYMIPNGADTAKRVNIYTMVYDFRVLDLVWYHSFMQTNPLNDEDADLFVMDGNGKVGLNSVGYTKEGIIPGQWYRLAVVVNQADTGLNNGVKYYFNGVRKYNDRDRYAEIDSRVSIGGADEPVQLLLFADNDGDDTVIEVAKVSIYEQALTDVEVAALGGFKSEVFTPVGQWDFNNPEDLTEATYGSPFELVGTMEVAEGPADGNGAISIGVGSYLKALTGIAPNGGGAKVNNYALSIDFRVNQWSDWTSLIQINPLNDDDGDLFLTSPDYDIGVGDLGYSESGLIDQGDWYRMVMVANAFDATSVSVDIYLDGIMVVNGDIQTVDSRFALENTLLFFADNDGEDNLIDVARVAIYDSALTSLAVAELGGYQHGTVEESIVGWWKFDNADSLTEATVGNPLLLTNKDGADPIAEAVAGPETGNGAVKIGPRNHFIATPDMLPSGGGLKVNRYTIGFDFSVEALGNWRAFYQTDSLNENDAEFFIRPTGELGVGDLGYSYDTFTVAPNEWYRLIMTVDLLDTTTSAVEYYIDGYAVPHDESDFQRIDNRFAFGPMGYVDQLILLGDNDGDDGIISVSEVVLFDRVLSAEEVEAWGGFGHVVGVEENSFVPEIYSLNQNYPNPFNPSTIISYSIPTQSIVTLKVYNLLGELVANIVDKTQMAGNHQFQFDASHLASGIYFYSLKAGDFYQTKKMMLLK